MYIRYQYYAGNSSGLQMRLDGICHCLVVIDNSNANHTNNQ